MEEALRRSPEAVGPNYDLGIHYFDKRMLRKAEDGAVSCGILLFLWLICSRWQPLEARSHEAHGMQCKLMRFFWRWTCAPEAMAPCVWRVGGGQFRFRVWPAQVETPKLLVAMISWVMFSMSIGLDPSQRHGERNSLLSGSCSSSPPTRPTWWSTTMPVGRRCGSASRTVR